MPGFGCVLFLRQYVPGSMLSKLDLASGWRSSDLGVNIISWWEKERKVCVLSLAGQFAESHSSTPCCSYRLPERQQDLSAQNVEVVGRSGAVDNDPVAVVELTDGKVLGNFLTGRR